MNKKFPITKIDFLIYLVIIPLLLIVIFLFPSWVTDFFKLNLNQPNLISIFFSNYTHQAFSHLAGNLIAYFILILLILSIEKNKKEFYGFSVFAFFIFPFVIYPVTQFFFNLFHIYGFPPMLGFSGIVAFFNGYFFYCLYKFLKVVAFKELKLQFVVLLLTLDIIVWAVSILNFYLILLTLLFLALLIFNNLQGIKGVLLYLNKKIIRNDKPKRPINWKGFGIFVLFLVPLFTLISLLPSNPRTPIGIVNTPVHFFGLIMGIFLPYLYELVKSMKEKNKK